MTEDTARLLPSRTAPARTRRRLLALSVGVVLIPFLVVLLFARLEEETTSGAATIDDAVAALQSYVDRGDAVALRDAFDPAVVLSMSGSPDLQGIDALTQKLQALRGRGWSVTRTGGVTSTGHAIIGSLGFQQYVSAPLAWSCSGCDASNPGWSGGILTSVHEGHSLVVLTFATAGKPLVTHVWVIGQGMGW